MLSVVIPAYNAAETLPACFNALMPATVQGLIRQVVVADGGSDDATEAIAQASGADFVRGKNGRGPQLIAGAAAARGDWLLFLHADTVLAEGWEKEAAAFMAGTGNRRAGYFRFRFDDPALAAKIVAAGVALRCALLRMPYGDQGLLISREFYNRLGGYADMPLFEDVDMIRKIRRQGQLSPLKATAITSADRYRQDGYLTRVLKNFRCLTDYYRGIPPAEILERYL